MVYEDHMNYPVIYFFYEYDAGKQHFISFAVKLISIQYAKCQIWKILGAEETKIPQVRNKQLHVEEHEL